MVRFVKTVLKSIPTLEGAGVHLNRVFGYFQVPMLDPFLLLDDFSSDDPRKFIKGFPWHPHRGIETITYILTGKVEHGDSLGNSGIIDAGDVQWMTAGSGIIHQEMPKGDDTGNLRGFQLWANLPALHKMMIPRYQEIKKEQIPVIETEPGIVVKLICGKFNGISGPVTEIISDPEYIDVTLAKGKRFLHSVKEGYKVFAYVIEGQAGIGPDAGQMVPAGQLVLFGDGDEILVNAGETGTRFLLVAGKPFNEPISWHGPIVMNTDDEIRTALTEYQNGTFLKHR